MIDVLQAALSVERVTPDGRYVYEVLEGDMPQGEKAEQQVELTGEAIRITRCKADDPILEVPAQIEGLPVVEIGDEAFSGLANLEELTCSPQVRSIGLRAFSKCPRLRKIVLPESSDIIGHTWLHASSRVTDITFPAAATTLDASFFNTIEPERIRLGRSLREVDFPHLLCQSLKRIDIDEVNPAFCTDGVALYTKDGTELVCCPVGIDTYEVREGCRKIGEGAFAYNGVVREVVLPCSVVEIGPRAFAGSSLRKLDVPSSVLTIGERAFANARRLTDLQLGGGVEELGPSALEGCTSLVDLFIPRSVRKVGSNVFKNSGLMGSASGGHLRTDPENEVVHIDDYGLLYVRESDRVELVTAMDASITECIVADGTTSIGEWALNGLPVLERVVLPEGIDSIGANAFNECVALDSINFPSTLMAIGQYAFKGTQLRMLDPTADKRLGSSGRLMFHDGSMLEMGVGQMPGWSLAGLSDDEPLDPQQSYDEYRQSDDHTLALHPENQSFFVMNDLLCRWVDDDHTWANALLYIGESHVITIPYVVSSVAPYTFAGASQVSELHFFIHVKGLGASGLSRKSAPEVLVLHLDENDAEPPLRLYPAPSISGMNPLNRSFSEVGLNIRQLAFSCDRSLFYAKSEFARFDYEVRRLADGRYIDSSMEERFRVDIQKSFADICKEYAKRNDNSGFEMLADAGYINAENASDVVDMVQELGNVAVTGYLLEMKSERFAHARIDFGL